MSQRTAGRGLMVAGTLVTIVGLGIVAMRTLDVPRYWMPVIVGVALFVAGVVTWATSRH
ncbi:MAG: hypothetical protein ACREM3_01875 [Candidatus Rokuibacteriota bacterium]